MSDEPLRLRVPPGIEQALEVGPSVEVIAGGRTFRITAMRHVTPPASSESDQWFARYEESASRRLHGEPTRAWVGAVDMPEAYGRTASECIEVALAWLLSNVDNLARDTMDTAAATRVPRPLL